ncbi:MAG: hybrid sensor histidine kinase/response regulator [Alphaproteobacteria bacterium]|nr:hybrid sensor histidine kinase/response regulator [Alphaproteobacteria bacterium]
MNRRRFSLPVLAALAAAGFLLAAGLLMARYEDRLYTDQQIKNTDEQAHILAASVAGAVAFEDARAAQEYIGALSANPELLAAGVYDGRGQRIAGFSRGGATLPSRPPTPGYGDGHIDVTVPVTQNGAALGTVFLSAAAEPLQRRIARYIGLVLLVTMGALVIAVLSISQSALARRADQLSVVNHRLQDEMTERARTEEALRQAHKMEAVGQLSGGIAHDFNNLIMIVKGNLRLLRKRLDANAEQPLHYIAAAEEALDRAAHLTQRILAFSRRQPLKPEPVRLSTLVADLGPLLHHSLGEAVETETQLDANWWIRCDVNQMENVILNLAINARDAMPEGGRLMISTHDLHLAVAPAGADDFKPGEYVALTLRDNGVGMSEEVKSRAVDPFFTTKPLGKGTGLGLSMSFGFVRQSGGHLVIASVPGQGSEITIYMPRAEGAA